LCPSAISGDPQTIWKYNAVYHLISEHSNGNIPPSIPGQLLVQIFMAKEEENALGIHKRVTDSWRGRNDSDGFQQNMQKRDRSDTTSTSFSDSHDPKRSKLGGIPE
jgi:hypothetical protein